jgi:hypothetical protein
MMLVRGTASDAEPAHHCPPNDLCSEHLVLQSARVEEDEGAGGGVDGDGVGLGPQIVLVAVPKGCK